MKKYVDASISSSTFRAYRPAIKSYVAFCLLEGLGPYPADVTSFGVAEWLAHLAESTTLSSGTIGVYRSAVSSWCRRGTLSCAPAVGSSTAVTLVMQGITNLRRPAENVKKHQDRASQAPLTPAMLDQIIARTPCVPPSNIMILTAAAVGLHGMLRPVELLGSAQHRDRALQLSDIVFYRDEARTRVMQLAATLEDAGKKTPHHFTMRLGATKADPLGANEPHPVAARTAVVALWRWMHLRRELRPPASVTAVFVNPKNWAPLPTTELVERLRHWGQLAGLRDFAFTGRSMRRGGAAAMMANGASIPDIQAAGRWASAQMPALYAGAAAMQQRQLAITMAMASAPPGAGR